MKIEFADPVLALIETDQASLTKLPVGVIKSARRKIVVLRSAPDERTLRSWKSLHYEKLKGGRTGQQSIRLNDQYRMIFKMDEETELKTITVLAIEDYH